MKYIVGETYTLYDEIRLEYTDGSTSYVEPGSDVTITSYDPDSMQFTCDEKYHHGFTLLLMEMDRFFIPECATCGKLCDPETYNGACESCNERLDAKYKTQK